MKALLSAALTVATFLVAVQCAQAAAQKGTAVPGMFPVSASLKIAIVGDSTLRQLVTDSSAIPCGDAAFPAPCAFVKASPLAYPNVLGQRNTVYDLANLGAQTQGQHAIADVLSVQLPKLPADVNLVIVDIDASSAYAANPASATADFASLLSAIHAGAPKARLLVLGARDVRGADAAAITNWNFHQKSVAALAGARFVDMNVQFPMRDFPNFPDTQHPSTDGSKQIAAVIGTEVYGGTLAAPSAAAPPSASAATIAVPKSSLPPVPPRSQRIKIAVIGASGEINTILPGSPVPCGNLLSAPPCKYETLPLPSPFAYPNLLGLLANAEIINNSVGGAQAADAKTYGKIPDMLSDQVPKIPVDADVVILDIGIIDVSVNGATDEILNRANKIASAVRARAPNAHMIFMNIHDYATEIKTRVTAWDAHEAKVAAEYGAPLVDMHTLFPATDYADYPDEGHPSAMGAMKIALVLSTLIDKMRAP